MLRTGHADPAWFSQSFLAQAPASQVDQAIGSVENAIGAYQSLEFTPEAFVAHFAKGTYDILIHLDSDNQIDGLLFRPPATSANAAQADDVALEGVRLDTMLRKGHADPAWFSQSFLAQIPASKVDQVIGNAESALGAYQSLEHTPQGFVAHFAKGTDEILIHLDADGRIDQLLFRPPAT
jgi:hypothetical protein